MRRRARRLGITGYARNLSDGRVEVLAVGEPHLLDALAGVVREGPPWGEVRSFRDEPAVFEEHSDFFIR